MDEGEVPIFAFLPLDYKSTMVIVFENGKVARFSLESFETKTNRRRLTGAYSDKSKAVAFFTPVTDETEITIFGTSSQGNRALTINTGMLDIKSTRSTQGVQVMTLRGKHTVTDATLTPNLNEPERYKAKNIPALGAVLKDEDLPEQQMTL